MAPVRWGILSAMSSDVLKIALDTSGHQLRKCYEGISERAMDSSAGPAGMTARQMLEHFSECYEAYIAECEGRKYEWGSYKAADTSAGALLKAFQETRDRAVSLALSSEKPEVRSNALHYVALHDCYHVGQLCLIRLADDPSWDAYGIYEQHVA